MDSFLLQVARVFLTQYGSDVSRLTFVFPNRRAGLFFCKYLGLEAGRPILSPRVLTINNLFEELSGLKLDDRIDLLFRLYKIFTRVTGSGETFDNFHYWGEMLLSDFDDVDKYMADASKLFANIRDLRQIDDAFAYLSPEQLEVIRQFWTHFIPADSSERKQHFARTWEALYAIYDKLRGELRADGLAYEGMMFRDVAESLADPATSRQLAEHHERIVFVGLNALTTAERRLLLELRDLGIADFYWDYQSAPLRDADNRASRFVADNERDFPSAHALPPFPQDYRPQIDVVGVPSGVGQAKFAHEELCRLLKEGAIASPEHALDTAIVLPDETLLMPALYSIPPQVASVNVTMGYSLRNTPVSGLMQYLFDLQRTMRLRADGRPEFYHRSVVDILSHRYVASSAPELTAELIRDIRVGNRVFVGAEAFEGNELLSLIFSPITRIEAAADYLLAILLRIQQSLAEPIEEGGEEAVATTTTDNVGTAELEQEFIYHYYITVQRLADVVRAHHTPLSLTTWFRLLGRMTEALAIPFEGEPLSGLQVMGVLETRALDFENLLILSMNEGTFPLKKPANTFIPYNLRRGFGLQTGEHQDAVYAYHFYRLLSRARRVTLIYDTRDGGLQTGEVSRYVFQLKYHYGYPIREKGVTYDITIPQPRTISIAKTADVMRRLEQFMADNEGAEGRRPALSASTINSYLKCPLRFYFSTVEGLRQEDDVSETLEMNVFGDIFHAVMEEVYRGCRGKRIDADRIRAVMADEAALRRIVRQKFVEKFCVGTDADGELDGYNRIVEEVLLRYTLRVLENDMELTPFIFLGAEGHYRMDYPLSNGRRVRLMGKIDRLDEPLSPTARVRIVDYKTGSVELGFHDLDELFDRSEAGRYAYVMQVCFYAMLYLQRPSADAELPVVPHLYSLRSLFKADFESIPKVIQRRGASGSSSASASAVDVSASEVDAVSELDPGPISNFARIEPLFRARLTACLDEIFDPDVPFVQTDEPKNCQYCHLREVCRR